MHLFSVPTYVGEKPMLNGRSVGNYFSYSVVFNLVQLMHKNTSIIFMICHCCNEVYKWILYEVMDDKTSRVMWFRFTVDWLADPCV